MPRGNAWKNAEKAVATILKGKRVLRGADFSQKDVDVKVPDFKSLKIDSKYRKAWAHHAYLLEVQEKYCPEETDIPLLVTKHHRQNGAVAVLSLAHLGLFLDVIRELRAEVRDLKRRLKKRR